MGSRGCGLVRLSCDGASEWSQIEQLFGTEESDWEDVPVPEVAEGDEIEPCPVVLGTPVLSDTETLHHGMVQLDWQDIEDAGWYVVQYYHVKGGKWLDLPAVGVDIAFHGSSAVVSNLHGLSWLRVGAASCDGASEWSQIEELYGTKESDWEGVPVPEVAEGDEIEPCSGDDDTPDNSPATGAPTISGTAQVGETLTADTSGVADADGLSNVRYEYQWLGDDAAIAGATGSTYTLTDSEEGKAIKVEVSFIDDAGNAETLTSEATVVVTAKSNSPATGVPTISGAAQVGETLTANPSSIADENGLDSVQYEYQWLADDSEIAGATNATYTLATLDEGKVIKVQVSFTDDAGNAETLTSAATDAVAAKPNSPATGAPAISGTAQVGETLTADTSGIADADGLDDVSFAYRWLSNNGNSDTEIAGATGLTYTLADDHEGNTIKVKVSFTDDASNPETLTSEATDAVAARSNSLASGAPTISGTARVGETLTADTSGIADADGLDDVSFAYRWLSNNGNSDTEIAGATGLTYTLADDHEGNTIKVKVSFTDDAGNAETLTSAATAEVAPRPNSPATGLPVISGTARAGETLTANTAGIADADGLDDVSFSYRWLADDADISGATGVTYTLADDDQGKAIEVTVSFTDDAGNGETLTSAATAEVAPRPNSPATGLPAITGKAQVGETLAADTAGIADADGLENVTFDYQWLADAAEITGATAATYTLADTDEGKAIKVRASFTDDAGNAETLTSEATDAVAAAPEPPAQPTGLSATVSHEIVSLTWDSPNDDSVTGYVILRRDEDIHNEGTFVPVAPDTGTADITYTDASVEPEKRYVYRIEAINAQGASERSSWVRADTPAVPDPAPEAPARPTGLATAVAPDTVTLSWANPDDDSITGHAILRRDKDLQPEVGTFFTVTSDTGTAATTYTDDTVEPDKRYVYRIKAINANGMSEISSWARGYTPAE